MVAQIQGHGVEATLVMRPLQSFCTDRNEFRFVVGCPRRFGVPFDGAGPQNITFTVAHPVDALLQVFVGVDIQAPGKIIIGLQIRKAVRFAEFRMLGLVDQPPQYLALDNFPSFLLPR